MSQKRKNSSLKDSLRPRPAGKTPKSKTIPKNNGKRAKTASSPPVPLTESKSQADPVASSPRSKVAAQPSGKVVKPTLTRVKQLMNQRKWDKACAMFKAMQPQPPLFVEHLIPRLPSDPPIDSDDEDEVKGPKDKISVRTLLPYLGSTNSASILTMFKMETLEIDAGDVRGRPELVQRFMEDCVLGLRNDEDTLYTIAYHACADGNVEISKMVDHCLTDEQYLHMVAVHVRGLDKDPNRYYTTELNRRIDDKHVIAHVAVQKNNLYILKETDCSFTDANLLRLAIENDSADVLPELLSRTQPGALKSQRLELIFLAGTNETMMKLLYKKLAIETMTPTLFAIVSRFVDGMYAARDRFVLKPNDLIMCPEVFDYLATLGMTSDQARKLVPHGHFSILRGCVERFEMDVNRLIKESPYILDSKNRTDVQYLVRHGLTIETVDMVRVSRRPILSIPALEVLIGANLITPFPIEVEWAGKEILATSIRSVNRVVTNHYREFTTVNVVDVFDGSSDWSDLPIKAMKYVAELFSASEISKAIMGKDMNRVKLVQTLKIFRSIDK